MLQPNKDGSSSSIEHVGQSDVGKQARAGAVWSALQIVVRNVFSVGVTAVLARLLTPDDYGLLGMVATLTAFLLVFSDMGLSWATIQRRDLSQGQVSNLFWINAVVGGLLWLGCMLVAPLLADFYERRELRDVTMVMGVSFLFAGLAAQPFALLKRAMQFRAIAKIEIMAVATSACVAILLAVAGWGYWALVVQALSGQFVRLLLVIISSDIKLYRPRRGIGTRQMVSFGGLLALNGLLIYFARNLDSVLIGKYWGTEQLGYYNRAYFLMLFPSMLATGVLTNLMVPSLSAFQENKPRFGDAYRRAVRLVAFVGCPLAAGLALTAPEAVRLVYGERWMAVVPMLMWLSLASLTQPIYNTTGWLFTASGRAKSYFVLTVVNAVVLVLTFVYLIRQGATAVAMGYGLVMGLVLLWPALWIAHRGSGIRLSETVRALRPVFEAVLLMAIAVSLTGWIAVSLDLHWQWVFGLKVFAGVIAYAFASLALLSPMLRDDLLPMLPAGVRRLLNKLTA